MSKYIANIVTVSRIIFSVLLFFTAPFFVYFYIFYLICGISDMIDGSIARYFHTESETGSNLDSLADFIFFAISCFKILPNIKITCVFMIWAGLIFIIRLICIGINYRKDRSDYITHSFLNKLTGFLLFISVLFIETVSMDIILTVLCFIASIVSIHELRISLK